MRLKKTILLTIIAALLVGYKAQAQDLSKYHALFIGKFVDYIEWPGGKEGLTIGVVGNSRVLPELQTTVEQRGKAKLKKISGVADASGCDIIYLPSTQGKLFSTIKSAIEGKGVLLVTEDESYAAQGAGISFYTEGGKLKFIINKSATEAQNLKISSSLLSLAKLVN